MTKQERDWTLDRLNESLEGGLTQAQLSRMTGVKEAVLSTLRRGTYTGNVDYQLGRLMEYFRTKEAAAALEGRELDYVPTSISESAYKVIEICQLKGGLAIVCGDAGIGKTRAALKYKADNPSNTIYICLNPCVSSLKSALRLLAKRLNVCERAAADELWLSIADKLTDGAVIVLDEAQHLPIRTIEAFRAFSDEFTGRGQTLGVVMMGNRETLNRFSGRRQADFAQIANRTRQRKIYSTGHVTREDIKLLFPALDNEHAVNYLHKIAQGAEAVRGAVNLYCNAADNGDISLSGLRSMAQFMVIRI